MIAFLLVERVGGIERQVAIKAIVKFEKYGFRSSWWYAR
jgi:hypothetical protein